MYTYEFYYINNKNSEKKIPVAIMSFNRTLALFELNVSFRVEFLE